MVDIDELERLRGALENIGNLSLDGCIKVNTPHGLWVGTPDAYAREVLGMPWRAPEGHQRMTDTEIRELRAENARLRMANRSLRRGLYGLTDSGDADEIATTLEAGGVVDWDKYPPNARAALGEPQ